MDKNDYKIESVMTSREFKIQFSKLFVGSIFVMLVEKFVLLLENSKPLIKYGDIIYHFMTNILSVVAQLAASVAAAIIFYFCIEFANKKRDMEKYIDIRRTLLFSIYSHMKFFSRIEGFESIRLGNLNKSFYDADSVEIFVRVAKKEFTEHNREVLLEKVKQGIKYAKDFEGDLRAYNSDIESLKKCKDYGYIKNSKENIDSIIDEFEELEIAFECYNNPLEETDVNFALEEVANEYINFIQLTLYFEIDLNAFMKSINRYKIIDFMKLLD